jgi:hypothetical protein
MNRVSAGSSILLNDIYKQYQKNTSGNAMSQEKWKATYGNYDIVSAAVMVECGPNVDGYTLFGGQFRLGLLDLDTGKTFMVRENGQYIHSTLKGTQDVYLINAFFSRNEHSNYRRESQRRSFVTSVALASISHVKIEFLIISRFTRYEFRIDR